MVNKTFLPPSRYLFQTYKPL